MYFFNAGGIMTEWEYWEMIRQRDKGTQWCVHWQLMTSLVYEEGLWGGFKSLYFARLSVTNSGDPFDCNNCTVVFSCQLHASVLLQNPHTAPDPHPFGKQQCGTWLVSDYFSGVSQNWTLDYQRRLYKKILGKCVCWCLLACLFIYSFVYLLFGSGSINYSWSRFKSKQIHFASAEVCVKLQEFT